MIARAMNGGLYNDAEAMRRVTQTVLLLQLREPQADALIALAEYLYSCGTLDGLAQAKAAICGSVNA